jgi:hypothetical protein
MWFPGGGTPDPGVAVPGSTEPATPGLPVDGSNPGDFPDQTPWYGSGGSGVDEGFLPDEPQAGDEGFGGGEGKDGGSWWDWFDE